MKNDVERYTKEISKRLQLPGKLKKCILTELTSEIMRMSLYVSEKGIY